MPTFTTNWATKNFDNWQGWFAPLLAPFYRATPDPYTFKRDEDRPLRILEIGCFEGQATLWFVENLCKHPQSYIVCVDPHSYEGQIVPPNEAAKWMGNDHEAIQRRFLENTKPYRLPPAKVRYYEQQSTDFFRYETRGYGLQSFDLIYIDGNHVASCVLEDSINAWQYLAQGGYLLWDDYRWRGKTTRQVDRPRLAIDSFLACYRGQYEFISLPPPQNPKQICIRKTIR